MNADELSDRLMDASVRVGKVVDALPESRLGKHIAGQLVRCGTAFGPNYEEGRAAESRKDFVHKLRIALKELRETRFWLRLTVRAELLKAVRLEELVSECHELILILSKSITTARNNANRLRTSRNQPRTDPNTK